ncbi:nuclear transport factor 2 family protein [Pedobacter nanyangensis]|uniref:nuclear transport factor 2 family protein n=1 Tax=Pedobacter nanyangensis TaxID=1562389 RepID=UPI000DE1DB96|nr:nuclear transport factor 2 family protein [Pedobacter nanyangensis]
MTKDEILNLEHRLYQAIKESDVQVLDELLHENLLFVSPGGDVVTKEIDLNTYRNGDLNINELTPTVENLNIIDDMAVITLTIALKGSYKEQPFGAKYRYIRFWKEFPSGIKVIGGSGTRIGA